MSITVVLNFCLFFYPFKVHEFIPETLSFRILVSVTRMYYF